MADQIRWQLSATGEPDAESPSVEIRIRDRAGNETFQFATVYQDNVLPRTANLGVNYPNPFNPETAIPVVVPQSASGNSQTGDSSSTT
ncbi:MAG: hypothetical protein HN712_04045 [Gemmatimonadetes bacterium]|jgi:hypothetical protein|nr:hypothetical protein [Gemmatimonadota bacterium]